MVGISLSFTLITDALVVCTLILVDELFIIVAHEKSKKHKRVIAAALIISLTVDQSILRY
jgi:hypothetical protein